MDQRRPDPDWFRRLEAAFHEVRTLPEGDRAAWIAGRCQGDALFRERLERMLASVDAETPTHAIGSDLTSLESLASAAPGAGRRGPGWLVGMRLGAYRIVECRGEGGFGEVYLAEQLEPIRRRVAIKVLRDDRARGESVDRFKDEVESLARLEHPGIARIYDAGEAIPVREADGEVGPDGPASVLFIAMEFVDGAPITADAARRSATVVQRLRVVAAAVDAMQHAHQRGIIHRDIKPSNVLVADVDGGAAPKIIDFGIAKVMEESGHLPIGSDEASPTHSPNQSHNQAPHRAPSGARPGRTVTGVLGTPRYMSPEQSDRRRSRDVDTRTDIFYLGVILHELVMGAPPAAGVPVPESRATTFAIPVPRSMRDDLLRIIRKATHPDRDERYAAAAAFADDLRRVIAGEPVSAGPATFRYRAGRYLWRNRLVAAAVLVACAALLGGAVAAVAGLLKAREQAARADAVNGFLEDVLTSVDPERQGADVPLSKVMDEASSSVATRFAGQPLAEADTRLLIAATYANLWLLERAAHEYEIAGGLYAAALGPDDERTVRTRVRQFQVNCSLGKAKEMDAIGGPLLADVRRVLGERSREAATVELMRARLAVSRGRIDEGAEGMRRAEAWILHDLGDDAELVGWLMGDKIRILRRIAFNEGYVTQEAKDRLEEAYDLSIRLVEHERARAPSKVMPTLVAEIEHSRAALDTGRFQESLEVSTRVVDEASGTLSDCHNARLEAVELQTYALRAMGEGERALETFSRVMDCRRQLGTRSDLMLVSREFDLIPLMDYAGHFAESEAQCRRVIDALAAFGDMGAAVRFSAQSYLARALSRQGRTAEATELFTTLAAAVRRNQPIDSLARLYAFMAAHFATLGRDEEARMAIDASHAALPPETSGTWQYHVDDRLVVLIEAFDALGDTAEAEAYRARRASLLETNRARPSAERGPRAAQAP